MPIITIVRDPNGGLSDSGWKYAIVAALGHTNPTALELARIENAARKSATDPSQTYALGQIPAVDMTGTYSEHLRLIRYATTGGPVPPWGMHTATKRRAMRCTPARSG